MITEFAANEDGPAIAELFRQAGSENADLDWSNIRPWWLVARSPPTVVAAVQFICALPISRIEMLVVDQAESKREQIIAVGSLLDFAYGLFQKAGVRKVMFLATNQQFQEFVTKRYGARILEQGLSMEVDIQHEWAIRRRQFNHGGAGATANPGPGSFDRLPGRAGSGAA